MEVSPEYQERIRNLQEALGIAEEAIVGSLPLYEEAQQLTQADEDIHGRPLQLTPEAAEAYLQMKSAAAAEGHTLLPVSGYRSVEYQAGIIRRKLEEGQSLPQILRVNTPPGHSEHHTGRALDLTAPGEEILEESFENSPAFAWLQENAWRFGFSLSYPRGNPYGIAYEPWHWCFRP